MRAWRMNRPGSWACNRCGIRWGLWICARPAWLAHHRAWCFASRFNSANGNCCSSTAFIGQSVNSIAKHKGLRTTDKDAHRPRGYSRPEDRRAGGDSPFLELSDRAWSRELLAARAYQRGFLCFDRHGGGGSGSARARHQSRLVQLLRRGYQENPGDPPLFFSPIRGHHAIDAVDRPDASAAHSFGARGCLRPSLDGDIHYGNFLPPAFAPSASCRLRSVARGLLRSVARGLLRSVARGLLRSAARGLRRAFTALPPPLRPVAARHSQAVYLRPARRPAWAEAASSLAGRSASACRQQGRSLRPRTANR